MPRGIYDRSKAKQRTHTPARDASSDTSAAATPPPSNGHTAAPAAEHAEVALSDKLTRMIEGIRSDFVRGFVGLHSSWTQTKAELAPDFTKAFAAYKKETGMGLADFARIFDPTVPRDVKAYKAHKTYNAANQLLRSIRVPKKRHRGPKPLSALDGMSQLIAAVLPLISADQVGRLWETIQASLHWTERQREALQKRTADAPPLLALRPPVGAGGAIPQLLIAEEKTHMVQRRGKQDRRQEHKKAA